LAQRRKYRKRAGTVVVAIQLDLDTTGFTYRKWGAEQTCKRGDWIVSNLGDVYTVDGGAFASTYRAQGQGLFRKVAPVWAEVADRDGAIRTKQGVTHYTAGSYLVFNDEQGQDGYAVAAPTFESMYEPAD
jgi:hypothetical protein